MKLFLVSTVFCYGISCECRPEHVRKRNEPTGPESTQEVQRLRAGNFTATGATHKEFKRRLVAVEPRRRQKVGFNSGISVIIVKMLKFDGSMTWTVL
jgi:hypothetical protein